MNRIIALSPKQMELIEQAIKDGKKSFVYSDCLFNIYYKTEQGHKKGVEVQTIHAELPFKIPETQIEEIKKMLK